MITNISLKYTPQNYKAIIDLNAIIAVNDKTFESFVNNKNPVYRVHHQSLIYRGKAKLKRVIKYLPIIKIQKCPKIFIHNFDIIFITKVKF